MGGPPGTNDRTFGGRREEGLRGHMTKNNPPVRYMWVLVPTTYENEKGKAVDADAEVLVEPGKTVFVDELPSPFDCDPEGLTDLPVHDAEQD